MNKIYLQKINNKGKEQDWTAFIDGNTVKFEWGQKGGKLQIKEVEFLKGKNIGRANETTPEEQCLKDTIAKAVKKIETGYVVIEGEELISSNLNENTVLADVEVPKPMLANTYTDHLKKFENEFSIYVQPKLDGNRCLVNVETGKAYSRSRKEIVSVPHIGEEVKRIFSGSGIEWVDGELYSHEISFNDIQSYVRKKKDVDFEATKVISLSVFDFVDKAPFIERSEKLKEIFEKNEVTFLELVQTYKIRKEDLQAAHNRFVEQGYEGLMIRKPNSAYEQKRSMGLFKYKNFFDDEFEVVGFEAQEKNPDLLGTVVVVDKNGTRFPATPAMPHEMRAYIFANQDEFLGKLATVRYQELFEDTKVPRFGVLKSFRDPEDMDAE